MNKAVAAAFCVAVMALVAKGSPPYPNELSVGGGVVVAVVGSDGVVTGVDGWSGEVLWALDTGGDLVAVGKGEVQFVPAFRTAEGGETQSIDFYLRNGDVLQRQGKLDSLVGVPPTNIFQASKIVREYEVNYRTGEDSHPTPDTISILRHDISVKVKKPAEGVESVQVVGNLQLFASALTVDHVTSSSYIPRILSTVDGYLHATDDAGATLWDLEIGHSPVKMYTIANGAVSEVKLTLRKRPVTPGGATDMTTLRHLGETQHLTEACANEINGNPYLQVGVIGKEDVQRITFDGVTLERVGSDLLELELGENVGGGKGGGDGGSLSVLGRWKYAPLVVAEMGSGDSPRLDWVPQDDRPNDDVVKHNDDKAKHVAPAHHLMLIIGGFLSAVLALVVAFGLKLNTATNLFRRRLPTQPQNTTTQQQPTTPKLSLTEYMTEYTSTGDLETLPGPLLVSYEKKGSIGERDVTAGIRDGGNSMVEYDEPSSATTKAVGCDPSVFEQSSQPSSSVQKRRKHSVSLRRKTTRSSSSSSSSSSGGRLGDRVFTNQGDDDDDEGSTSSSSSSNGRLGDKTFNAAPTKKTAFSSCSSSQGSPREATLFCHDVGDESDTGEDSSNPSEHPHHHIPEVETSTYKQNYVELYHIGEGGCGSVWLAENKTDKKRYAVKKIRLKDEEGDSYAKEQNDKIKREASLHASLDHPNIARYNWSWEEALTLEETRRAASRADGSMSFTSSLTHSVAVGVGSGTRKHLFIAMKYYMEGSLRDWMLKRNAIDAKTNLRFLLQLVSGLSHLHENQLLHRDMKPSNILLEKQGKKNMLKICDFGLSTIKHLMTVPSVSKHPHPLEMSQTTGAAGTPLYSSPEQWGSQSHGKSSDIYSLGVIFYELYLLDPSQHEKIRYLQSLSNVDRATAVATELEKDFPQEMELVREMTHPVSKNRPVLKEIKLRAKNMLKKILEKKAESGGGGGGGGGSPRAVVPRPEPTGGYESDVEAETETEEEEDESDEGDEE